MNKEVKGILKAGKQTNSPNRASYNIVMEKREITPTKITGSNIQNADYVNDIFNATRGSTFVKVTGVMQATVGLASSVNTANYVIVGHLGSGIGINNPQNSQFDIWSSVVNGVSVNGFNIKTNGSLTASGATFYKMNNNTLLLNQMDCFGHMYNRGNLMLGTTTAGLNASGGVMVLSNTATAPTTSVDLTQLYSVDLSAGNATLGIRTETTVAAETVTSDATLSVVINGTTYKLLLKT